MKHSETPETPETGETLKHLKRPICIHATVCELWYVPQSPGSFLRVARIDAKIAVSCLYK